jgi:hypothetical protein
MTGKSPEENTMKPDLGDHQNYRLVRLQNDKIVVQSKIDERTWWDEKEVTTIDEGSAEIYRLVAEKRNPKK